MMLPADYHMHTPYCKHATGGIEDYRAAAVRRGVAEICFTDHVPAPDGYDTANRMDLDQFPLYEAEVGRVRSVAGPAPVRFGVEADYYEGCEGFLRDWLPRQSLDLVLGSVHYLGDWGFDNPATRATWDQIDVGGAWAEYFALLSRLADTRLFDVVGHLDLPKKFGHRPPDPRVKEMARPALDRVAAAGMGIEINTSGLRRPVGEMYPSPLLLSLAHERGIPICFGSDAHTPDDVGYAFEQAVELAKSAGYRECLRFRERRAVRVPLP